MENLVNLAYWPSMRPGQETPDEVVGQRSGSAAVHPFNEAGARNPG